MFYVLLIICSSVVIIFVVGLCLCGRRKTQKNDWLGLDGMVTQKNPDENVNHLPSVNALFVPNGNRDSNIVALDANDQRLSATNNPRRSLPDIPLEGVRDADGVVYEPSGDNFSELYATVEPYQNGAKVSVLAKGAPSRPSISQHSSISQADEALSPYARVREHPYDKLLKTEHPYASVKSPGNDQVDANNITENSPCLLEDIAGVSQCSIEPVAPPRSRRSSSHNSTCADIPAASAVAGVVPANQELPYMTPPIAQTNFSGDSQDSSKGYTSITVREPLANIRAQITEQVKVSREGDPHYSTVSDDSDEMYTTIQDPNNPLYTSGSETYAQIQPLQITVAVEVNPVPQSSTSSIGSLDPMYETAPQPPSVDSLKHVTHSHSRQASNSSSVGVLGSPKPEKRQANSPLPAPPSGNVDDMYAKVQKNLKNKTKPENNGECSSPNNQSSRRSSGSSSRTSFENVTGYHQKTGVKSSHSDSHVMEDIVAREHDYETLKKTHAPKWSQTRQSDPIEPGYDVINSPPSLAESDPGYEIVKNEAGKRLSNPGTNINSKRPLALSANALMDGYSVVNKKNNNRSSNHSSSFGSDTNRDLSTTEEPNYESMPSESYSEHNYAVLKSESDTDPNYESVNHNDPNYESVKYLDVGTFGEPPYERLQDEDSSKDDVPGYERVGNVTKRSDKHSDYETVNGKRAVANGKVEKVEGSEDVVLQV